MNNYKDVNYWYIVRYELMLLLVSSQGKPYCTKEKKINCIFLSNNNSSRDVTLSVIMKFVSEKSSIF